VSAVSDPVVGCVPVVYVTDIELSVRFYTLLGFRAGASGSADEWRYSYLTCAATGLLLAAGGSVWSAEQGPVLLYLRVADVEAAQRALEEAGHAVEHLGYPDHAPGGELKVLDPDGHGLLLGQVTGAPPADRRVMDSTAERTNVLVRAAEAARRRGVTAHRCQFPLAIDQPCPEPADVKLADSWGDSTWVCLPHAEEVMLNARGAFIASEDSEGLAVYLRRRQGLT
jgi:catechol 2,3-dioxygenase-like lactoylglutathione lyase family enzyme